MYEVLISRAEVVAQLVSACHASIRARVQSPECTEESQEW